MELIQLDYISNFALEVLPKILAVNQEGLTENQKVTYNHLKQWNGKEDVGSKGRAFFHSFLNKFIV